MHQPTTVLVTGGAGFIGANFLLKMVPRHPEVRYVNLDLLTYAGNLLSLRPLEGLPNYAFVHGDIADADLVARLFEEHDVTTVVHFAAESHVDRSILDPLAFVRTNIVGTATLLEAARRRWFDQPDSGRFRFYHVSTDEVFGSLGEEGAFREDTPARPTRPPRPEATTWCAPTATPTACPSSSPIARITTARSSFPRSWCR
jgi:dTDP-glucose 4,6-dehydratase